MLRIAKKTRYKAEEIVQKASAYFGEGGENLAEKERNPCCVSFEGGGGYVSVSITDEARHRIVDVETREFEYQAKRFLELV